jgi:hypothetical protein
VIDSEKIKRRPESFSFKKISDLLTPDLSDYLSRGKFGSTRHIPVNLPVTLIGGWVLLTHSADLHDPASDPAGAGHRLLTRRVSVTPPVTLLCGWEQLTHSACLYDSASDPA